MYLTLPVGSVVIAISGSIYIDQRQYFCVSEKSDDLRLNKLLSGSQKPPKQPPYFLRRGSFTFLPVYCRLVLVIIFQWNVVLI